MLFLKSWRYLVCEQEVPNRQQNRQEESSEVLGIK